MAEKKTVTYIQTSEYSMVGGSDTLAPGERVLFDEDSDSHSHLQKLIDAQDPSVAHLSIIEVDPEQEAKAAEEREEMLAEAAEIAAEARAEEMRAAAELQAQQEDLQVQAQEEGQSTATSETDFPPQDQEAIDLAKQSGAEDDQPKSGRRTSKKGG